MTRARPDSLAIACSLCVACGQGSGVPPQEDSGTSTSDPGTTADVGTSSPADSTGSTSSTGSTDSTDSSLSEECRDYVGSVTLAQVAMTPRESAEAELLAIEASGEIVAPQALYDRIVVELAALRAAAPEVAAIGAYPAWSPSAVRVTLDGEGLAAYAEGTYHGWDCPNELYRMTEIEISLGTFIVRLEGRYDVMQVGDDYLAAEHVSDVGRESYIGDGPDLCLSIAADVHTYIFDDARGDCPAGCTMHLYTGFTVDPEGTITPLGSYELYGPEPAPAWYEDADACTTWL